MKKRRIIASILAALIAVCALTGCALFKPTAVSLARDMAEKLSGLKSVTAGIEVDYDGTVSMSGVNADIGIEADLDLEAVPASGTSHVKGDAVLALPVVGTFTIPVESYQEIEDGKAVIYTSTDGSRWVRTTGSVQGAQENAGAHSNSEIVLGLLQKIVSGEVKAELAEKTEKIGEQEVYRLDVTVSGDLMEEMLRAASASNEGGAALPKDLDLTGADAKITLYVDKETKYPAVLKVDCTALGNVLMQSYMKDMIVDSTAKQFVITVTFREFNTLESLEIPEEVKSSAVEGGGNGALQDLVPGDVS